MLPFVANKDEYIRVIFWYISAYLVLFLRYTTVRMEQWEQ